jgi:hypothetical protein
MRATLLSDTIKAVYRSPSKRSVCIEGPPGGGKTSIVRQLADDLGVAYIERHMPTMLVEDFGVPYPSADGSSLTYKLPDWFPRKDDPNAPKEGILCFDDRNQAPADLQKVLANIIQARNLHGIALPDGWMVVSTGNRQADRAGANRVLSHLRNRETVVELETHLEDWTRWAGKNGVRGEVIGFINFRPGLLHDFDPQRDVNPTPRAWVDGVSNFLGVVPAEAEYECFKGAVGECAAAEFVGFLRIFRQLPDPAGILKAPKTATVPTDPATLYALSGALAEIVTDKTFANLTTYLERVPPEFGVLTVQLAVRRNPGLTSTQAFVQWATKNSAVLF